MIRIKAFFIGLFLTIATSIAYCQPGDEGGDVDNAVPLTGLGYLLVAGALLGVRRMYQNFRNRQ